MKKIFNLIWFYFSIIDFIVYVSESYPRSQFHEQKLWKLPLCFLNDCYRFRSFKSLVYFELHFGVWFKMWEQIHSFSHSYPAFPKSFTLKNIFSQWCVFDTFIKYPLTASACIYLWTFYSIPMVYMSVFMLVVYWKRSVLIAIPKEDSAQKCTDYHSIVLIYFFVVVFF